VMDKGEVYKQRFTITEKVYSDFTRTFNDYNPLHTDESFAKEKGFTSVVMHGNILGGFISHFIGECLPLKNVIIHTQQIKYYNPAYLNQPLDFTATISDVVEAVKVVMFDFVFNDVNGLKIAKGKIQIGLI
jgi:acyl dehydratase